MLIFFSFPVYPTMAPQTRARASKPASSLQRILAGPPISPPQPSASGTTPGRVQLERPRVFFPPPVEAVLHRRGNRSPSPAHPRTESGNSTPEVEKSTRPASQPSSLSVQPPSASQGATEGNGLEPVKLEEEEAAAHDVPHTHTDSNDDNADGQDQSPLRAGSPSVQVKVESSIPGTIAHVVRTARQALQDSPSALRRWNTLEAMEYGRTVVSDFCSKMPSIACRYPDLEIHWLQEGPSGMSSTETFIARIQTPRKIQSGRKISFVKVVNRDHLNENHFGMQRVELQAHRRIVEAREAEESEGASHFVMGLEAFMDHVVQRREIYVFVSRTLLRLDLH